MRVCARKKKRKINQRSCAILTLCVCLCILSAKKRFKVQSALKANLAKRNQLESKKVLVLVVCHVKQHPSLLPLFNRSSKCSLVTKVKSDKITLQTRASLTPSRRQDPTTCACVENTVQRKLLLELKIVRQKRGCSWGGAQIVRSWSPIVRSSIV